MTVPLAADTSVAIPLLVQTHAAHRAVTDWATGRSLAMSGHAAAETYAVLTRLPGDVRVTPADAARLLAARFAPTLLISESSSARLPELLSTLDIAGGAVYDALVALAAHENGAQLVTRDARARDTYEKVGVRTVVMP